ncbi:hypothetical protein ACWEQA_00870 [Nocardia sp. NPDC004085]
MTDTPGGDEPATSDKVHDKMQSTISAAARSFIVEAFEVLTRRHVIPRPSYNPYASVGYNYFGDDIRPLGGYARLEAELNRTYSERFAETLRDQEFASSYIFEFLDACIARCAHDEDFSPNSRAVDATIEELFSVLNEPDYDVVVVRHVSHLTTTTGSPITIGDTKIVPQPENSYGLQRQIGQEIVGVGRAWRDGNDPRPFDPPHSILVVRERTSDADPWIAASRLSGKLEKFLLIARLLTAGTVRSNYEVSGPTTLVSRMDPTLEMASNIRGFRILVRRTVRLSGEEAPAFTALGNLIDSAEVKRDGMVATSFDVALSKFNGSHHRGPFEHIVDLATALEAALLGGEKETEGLSLRLRTRVAALLATDDDSGEALFRDVAKLYDIRSKLVHGGQIPERDLRKLIAGLSTVPPSAQERFGVAMDYAVDRMRDVVRRAILARLCLAAKPDAPWPFVGSTAVDASLADDNSRAIWRQRWRSYLDQLGVGYAADQPRAAVEFLSKDDR